MTDYNIKLLTKLMVPAAIVVHRAAFQQDADRPIGGAGGWTEDSLRNSLALNAGLAATVEATPKSDRTIAGVILWQEVDKTQREILTLAVSPDYQRCGIATRLLAAAGPVAGELLLEVAANNLPALCCYQQLGFMEQGRRPKYYPGDVDAVVMVRKT